MAHELLTGIEGRVKTAAGIYANTQNWAIDPADDVHVKRTSGTRGAAVRVKGIEKWSGSFEAYGSLPAVLPGAQFVFTGAISGGSGAGDARTVSGTARVDECVIIIDYESGEPIGHTVSFSADGTLSYSDANTVALDALVNSADFVIPEGSTHPVKYDDLAGALAYGSTLADVRKVTITLTTANPERITSSTAGVARHDAGNPDAKVSIEVLEGSAADWWKIGEEYALRCYVTGSTYWEFQFLSVEKLTNIQVDPESDDLIGATYEMALTSVAVVNSTETAGKILDPSTAEWWTGTPA